MLDRVELWVLGAVVFDVLFRHTDSGCVSLLMLTDRRETHNISSTIAEMYQGFAVKRQLGTPLVDLQYFTSKGQYII